jgi:hypothetical protein
VSLIDKDTGAIIRTIDDSTSATYFAQPAFANGWLYTARIGGLMMAFHP